jgi:hypothetical protein
LRFTCSQFASLPSPLAFVLLLFGYLIIIMSITPRQPYKRGQHEYEQNSFNTSYIIAGTNAEMIASTIARLIARMVASMIDRKIARQRR